MNYQQTIEYLFNSTPVFEHVGASAYKEGLYNTEILDRHFKHPHTKFKTIHVAGTNGKGSCSHTIAAILQAEGYKVGLYTSPHLIDFRERIRINGECISENYVIDFVENERNFFESLHPSFFELTTAMAFKYFADNNVEIAVIEVGLGGRLDCTNIINPVLSIITNISFDHTQFLGNTLSKIATEKAGIIKSNTPVVIGEATSETRPVFEKIAKLANAQITFAEDNIVVDQTNENQENEIIYHTTKFGILHSHLTGMYQLKNTNTILNAIDKLQIMGIIQNSNSIVTGFNYVSELTGLQGRWQTIQTNPYVVCDTGHNLAGWQFLSKQIKKQNCKNRRIVFGMVDDKDINSVMKLLPKDGVYYFTRATTHRAINEHIVKEIADKHKLKGNCYKSVAEAYIAALDDAEKDDFIFVGGSSYIVADLLTYLKEQN